MNKRIFFAMIIMFIPIGIILTRCTKTDDTVLDPYVIKLVDSPTYGSYIADKDGNALYFFSNDANGANNCTGGCITAWPMFNVTGLTQDQLSVGLLLEDFNSISTPNGDQVTYKGWPLYYYAPGGILEQPGQITGDGIGGVWFIAKSDYSIMLAKYQLVGLDTKSYIVSDDNVYSEGIGTTIYFTDLMGRTLYAFANDSASTNKFTKPDFSNNSVWPIYETDQIVVPSVLDKLLFGSISVYGRKQLTYKGRPIYYFGSDVDDLGKFRGNTKGVSVPVPNVWPVFIKDIPAATHN